MYNIMFFLLAYRICGETKLCNIVLYIFWFSMGVGITPLGLLPD